MLELLSLLHRLPPATVAGCRKAVVRGDGGELRVYTVSTGDGVRMWAEGGIIVVVDYNDGSVRWYHPREAETVETGCGEKDREWVDVIVMGKDGDATFGHEVYGVWLEAREKGGEVTVSAKVKRRYRYLVDGVYEKRRKEAVDAGMRALAEYLRVALEALNGG